MTKVSCGSKKLSWKPLLVFQVKVQYLHCDLVDNINISDGVSYIFKTCHLTMKKGKLLSHAVSNKLEIFQTAEVIK